MTTEKPKSYDGAEMREWMKKEICRGCDNLKDRIHTDFYEDDGVTKLKEPLKTMAPYCIEYGGLHLEFCARILRDSGNRRYGDDDFRYCPRFRN